MPLLHVLLSIIQFFILVAWIWVVIAVISDVFRSKDLNGLERALWVIGIIVIPLVGVLVYLFIRGDSMAERSAQAAAQIEEMRRSYYPESTRQSIADELTKLAELKDRGIITEDELQAQKNKLLS